MRQFIGEISRTLTSGHLRTRISKPSRITLPQEALRLGRNRQNGPRNGYISMYHSHKSEPGFYYMPRIIRTRWWSDIRAIRGKRRHNRNSLVSIQSPDRFVISDQTGDAEWETASMVKCLLSGTYSASRTHEDLTGKSLVMR